MVMGRIRRTPASVTLAASAMETVALTTTPSAEVWLRRLASPRTLVTHPPGPHLFLPFLSQRSFLYKHVSMAAARQSFADHFWQIALCLNVERNVEENGKLIMVPVNKTLF